jgi:putative CocE/NonD family hydrolase
MFELADISASLCARVHIQWGVRIPLRDGSHLSATLYLPKNLATAAPVIFTLTPYVAQTWHPLGLYFAGHDYPFLSVDVRGRGNSEGDFCPFVHEAKDGYDVVEWLVHQKYCDGRVAMWGGSYGAYAQWATAREKPPHLATIVPAASPYIGVDMPIQNNIATPYLMQWLTLVSGRTSQEKMFFGAEVLWGTKFREWFESGSPFRNLDTFLGNTSAIFQGWVSHPHQDSYWDSFNPTSEQYGAISIPVLTITGSCDSDQSGALMHYREHLANATPEVRARHYLVIGPWDHLGTRTPKAEFCGLKVGPASVVDLAKLHLEWYSWTMQGGPKPEFLQKNVAYYVLGADKWRYADTLDAITAHSEVLYLGSIGNPTDVFHSGSLNPEPPARSEPDTYVYDPSDIEHAELESTMNPESRSDQRMIYGAVGKQLIYHSAPFDHEREISGFFSLHLWVSIDQRDTDLRASVFSIALDGSSVLLSTDFIRARHRESLRAEKLIDTHTPLRYHFERFTFISYLIERGSRLRLVIGPINSIYSQKNYNSGGAVSDESLRDARPVTVKLFRDCTHPSAIHVPFAHEDIKTKAES